MKGPQFNPQYSCGGKKVWMWWHMLVISVLERERKRMFGVLRTVSLRCLGFSE